MFFFSIFSFFKYDTHMSGFFVSYSHGNEKYLCYYVLFSFFYEYHFAFNMKHNVKVAR